MSGTKKFTKADLKKIARKYSTRVAFKKGAPSAYQLAWQQGLLDECCRHMTKLRDSHTLKTVCADARKYSTIRDWRKNSLSIYRTAHRNGWLPRATKHMNRLTAQWTEKSVLKVAKSGKFSSRSQMQAFHPALYLAAYRRGLLDKIFGAKK